MWVYALHAGQVHEEPITETQPTTIMPFYIREPLFTESNKELTEILA